MVTKATRVAFGEALAELGERDERVVVLDADLSKSTMSTYFHQRCPERFFEMGIQEANMIGTGAGLALAGKVPFICSFACFITGRYDQIRISIAYSGANVRIVGTHAGIGIGPDGYSQQGIEDIAIMRCLPTMGIIQPADDLETASVVDYLINVHDGPVFLRLTREKLPRCHQEGYKFAFGHGDLLRPGKDVTLIATGALVSNTLQAAEILAGQGVEARVINIHTIKPIDREMIIQAARETGRLITVEDHTIIGGLGSAVAEVLTEEHPVPLMRIGIPDVFGESGDPKELYCKYQLDGEGIAHSAKSFLNKA